MRLFKGLWQRAVLEQILETKYVLYWTVFYNVMYKCQWHEIPFSFVAHNESWYYENATVLKWKNDDRKRWQLYTVIRSDRSFHCSLEAFQCVCVFKFLISHQLECVVSTFLWPEGCYTARTTKLTPLASSYFYLTAHQLIFLTQWVLKPVLCFDQWSTVLNCTKK